MSGTTMDDLETHITSHLLEVETWKHTGKTITLTLNKANDPFQTMGAPIPSFGEQIGGNADAKTSLNQFCQKYCKKPIAKTDVIYTTGKVGAGYQSTVKLVCINNMEFAGEISVDAKTAEKSAAQQALDHHADVINSMPGTAKKAKKSSGTVGMSFATADGSTSPKAELNVTCAKILRTVISKTDIAYEVSQVEGQGFQATVQMPGLPGHYATQVWAGEVHPTKNEAEQSAAQQAVQAIRNDPTLMAIASQPTSAQQKRNAKGNPFSMGKGRQKGKGGKNMQDVVNAMNAMAAMGLPSSLGKGGKGGW